MLKMNKLAMKKFFLYFFFLLLTISTCNAQLFHKSSARRAEKGLFGKTRRNSNEIKVKEPRKVTKAKKQQEANQKRLKSDYNLSIKRSQKRTIEIQTADVQARMKQDRKNSIIRDRVKRKRVRASSRKAGNKYK